MSSQDMHNIESYDKGSFRKLLGTCIIRNQFLRATSSRLDLTLASFSMGDQGNCCFWVFCLSVFQQLYMMPVQSLHLVYCWKEEYCGAPVVTLSEEKRPRSNTLGGRKGGRISIHNGWKGRQDGGGGGGRNVRMKCKRRGQAKDRWNELVIFSFLNLLECNLSANH